MDEGVKVNLLLVDDKPDNLLALEAVLDSLDCDILKANSGSKALEILETNDVALILLDVQMPIMDGFETARRIKEKFPEKNAPIIFMSAVYTQDPYIQQGYEVGGLDYIPKPFDPGLLKEKVRIYTEVYKQSHIRPLLEKQLGETAVKYKLLLDNIPDLVCMTTVDETITFLNKTIESYTGYKQEEWIGISFSAFLHDDDILHFKKNFEKALMDRHHYIFKVRILTKSRKYIPVEAYLNPISDDSRMDGAILIARDLSGKILMRDGAGRKRNGKGKKSASDDWVTTHF